MVRPRNLRPLPLVVLLLPLLLALGAGECRVRGCAEPATICTLEGDGDECVWSRLLRKGAAAASSWTSVHLEEQAPGAGKELGSVPHMVSELIQNGSSGQGTHAPPRSWFPLPSFKQCLHCPASAVCCMWAASVLVLGKVIHTG